MAILTALNGTMLVSTILPNQCSEGYQTFGLPSELLILVFKAQGTIADVLRLSSTCQSLRRIWLANFSAIVDEVLSKEKICYPNALRLAEAQSMENGAASQSMNASVHSPLNKDILRLHGNAREALRVCSVASSYFLGAPPALENVKFRLEHSCSVHPPYFLPHEQERMIHCWYFLKLYALSYFSPPLRQSCDSELASMSGVEGYGMWQLILWLCEEAHPGDQETLGIWGDDPPVHLVDLSTVQVREWYQTRKSITNAYIDKAPYGSHLDEAIYQNCYGPCDKCTGKSCKPRDASKGLWDL